MMEHEQEHYVESRLPAAPARPTSQRPGQQRYEPRLSLEKALWIGVPCVFAMLICISANGAIARSFAAPFWTVVFPWLTALLAVVALICAVIIGWHMYENHLAAEQKRLRNKADGQYIRGVQEDRTQRKERDDYTHTAIKTAIQQGLPVKVELDPVSGRPASYEIGSNLPALIEWQKIQEQHAHELQKLQTQHVHELQKQREQPLVLPIGGTAFYPELGQNIRRIESNILPANKQPALKAPGQDDYLPPPYTLSEVLEHWEPTKDGILLAKKRDLITVPIGEALCHTTFTGNTDAGKTNDSRDLIVQLLYLDQIVFVCDLNWQRYRLDKKQPGVVYDYSLIEQLLAYPPATTTKEAMKVLIYLLATVVYRRERRRKAIIHFPDVYGFFDELPGFCQEDREVMYYVGRIVREARQHGVFFIGAAQDLLNSTLQNDSGAIRDNLLTNYYGGGDISTARLILNLPKGETLDETDLGKQGIKYLRAKGANIERERVRTALADNQATYTLLGDRVPKRQLPYLFANEAALEPPVNARSRQARRPDMAAITAAQPRLFAGWSPAPAPPPETPHSPAVWEEEEEDTDMPELIDLKKDRSSTTWDDQPQNLNQATSQSASFDSPGHTKIIDERDLDALIDTFRATQAGNSSVWSSPDEPESPERDTQPLQQRTGLTGIPSTPLTPHEQSKQAQQRESQPVPQPVPSPQNSNKLDDSDTQPRPVVGVPSKEQPVGIRPGESVPAHPDLSQETGFVPQGDDKIIPNDLTGSFLYWYGKLGNLRTALNKVGITNSRYLHHASWLVQQQRAMSQRLKKPNI